MKAIFNVLFWVSALVGAVALALFGATAAFAQSQPCGAYADVRAHLATKYDEDVIWVGLAPNETQIALYVADDGSTWTLLGIRQGQACMLSSGESWSNGDGIPPVILPPPARRAEP
jgi:hypothetical protein